MHALRSSFASLFSRLSPRCTRWMGIPCPKQARRLKLRLRPRAKRLCLTMGHFTLQGTSRKCSSASWATPRPLNLCVKTGRAFCLLQAERKPIAAKAKRIRRVWPCKSLTARARPSPPSIPMRPATSSAAETRSSTRPTTWSMSRATAAQRAPAGPTPRLWSSLGHAHVRCARQRRERLNHQHLHHGLGVDS